eukprot:CAMPEP_0203678104 /NCGR_PEP_ID=MMETSP0090-20130426/30725_1 /ASSEMBLY_ACC=CAM_ASM_001088 /TAXON_ID=426623 /ORGANISM="Chaetoceros affinis, Strain CCMP159" /LENGTH=42 /DNA_ID= /DNA_START= /DNA_END= /DNA_ORIENTATION=
MNQFQPQQMVLPRQNFDNEIWQDGSSFGLRNMQSSVAPSDIG